MSITPTRNFTLSYIVLDSLFVLVFLAYLFASKKRLNLLWSLFGGVLYWIVDFFYFYLISHSRVIYIDGEVASAWGTCLVLVWMSLSYGITNFAFIWACLDGGKDKWKVIFPIVTWWMLCPGLARLFPGMEITTFRTTNQYHWPMFVFLAVGYLAFLLVSIFKFKDRNVVWKFLWLNLIGFMVQFLWEGALFASGIRPSNSSSIATLFVDSLLETNLGMGYFYFIHLFLSSRYNEDLSPVRKVSENA